MKAKQLIDKKSNLNVKDTADIAYLNYCALYKQTEIAKYLISKGADINIKNKKGSKPFFYALINSNEELAYYDFY